MVKISLKAKKLVSVIMAIMVYMLTVIPVNASDYNKKAVVFVLDASGSMNTNDPEKLAIDSIAQLIYSLPTNYEVGVVAYNNNVVFSSEMISSQNRESIIKQAETIKYNGYTNAGMGLKTSVELLENTNAVEKTIVMLSDGEILMDTPEVTQKSQNIFNEYVLKAIDENITIDVVGLGSEIDDTDSNIFSAATKTGGSKSHVPKALDIQKAIDEIIVNKLNIKKTTSAVVESNGGENKINVKLPSKNINKVRILITSTKPITNLVADFSAVEGRQEIGKRYAIIELKNPISEEINIAIQSEKGSQVKVDFIPEYAVNVLSNITYEDIKPKDKTSVFDRIANIELSFIDEGSNKIFVEEYFNNNKILVEIGDKKEEVLFENGKAIIKMPVESEKTENLAVDFSNFNTNITSNNEIEISLEAPPKLPKPNYMIYVFIVLLVVLVYLIYRKIKSKNEVIKLNEELKPEPSKYGYVGKLNIYITRTKTGVDIPPLSIDLFRLSSGRVISLSEILEKLSLEEVFEGSERIFIKPGPNRTLILNNSSDCTIIKNRELLMKNKSYELMIDNKIDITFEDEKSEITIQYKDIKQMIRY